MAVDVDVFSGDDALEEYVHTEEQFGQEVRRIDTAQGRGVLRGLASGPGIGPMCVPLTMDGHSFPPIFEGQPIGCSARLWWWRARLWWWRTRTGRVPWWHRDSRPR